MEIKLMLGDNMESLKKLADNSVDSIVTDPPYGLSFMNKKWDYEVPSQDFWKECLRVLKPGGHVLSFGGTRTYHRMVVNMEDAGFEIRDQIQWLNSEGFPKNHNIGKILPEYEGWGTGLKPANEPICVARKPLSEKTVVANMLKWNTGGININASRIGTNNQNDFTNMHGPNYANGVIIKMTGTTEVEGRWPANIIFDEGAAAELDKQSGITKSSKSDYNFDRVVDGNCYGKNLQIKSGKHFDDKGGASRFFYVAKVGKKERNLGLDTSENKDDLKTLNNGFGGIPQENRSNIVKNNHPTLKPINLMTYLCKLVTPVGGVVLDPFMGSGSCGIAAALQGFSYIGMELDEGYYDIATARINIHEEYRKLLK